MAKSPQEMAQSMINNLTEKTGKDLDEWLQIVQRQPFEKHGEIMKFLKGEHGVTHGFANLIAQIALQGKDAILPSKSGNEELVAKQYSGDKAALLPVYEAVLAAVRKLGDDVEVAPKKTYVSLRRNKQFAIVQPSTKTRVDIGLNLKGVEPQGRLEAAGSFNAMVSHRVRITDKKEINAELKKWLKQAYEQA